MDIQKWTIFSLLEPEFVNKIRLVCVYGNLGFEALMITKDDEVFAIGSNAAGCLGTGDLQNTLMPRKVEALCNKGIKALSYGSGPHVMALAADGQIFSWGHNGYCELGNGTTKQNLVPSPVLLPTTHSVVEIACGSHHSMALTEVGEMYAWGQNNCGQVGSGMSTNQSTPRKVSGALTGKRVASIAAGQTCSMAVLENGELYAWGYNGNGQLGLGTNVNQQNPVRIPALENAVISKVVCGYAHTLAITDLGTLYAWGGNSYGQLGTGNKTNVGVPTLVATNLGRIVDIAATHYNHISAALTQSSRVYMWGQCRGQCVTLPTETPFNSMHDVFACFATPSITWKPLEVEEDETALDSLKMAFDDQSTSDLVIMVEGRPIHVHKALLKIRCQYFRTMFQDHWQEDSQRHCTSGSTIGNTETNANAGTGKENSEEKENIGSSLVISQFTHSVYRAFLQYLYSDEVNLPPESALELLDLANAYCENRLKRKCEQIIKRGITIENAALLYSTAIHYRAKELEEFCFKFSLNHMTAFTQTEGFNSLDEFTVKEFVRKAASNGVFRT